MKHTEQQLAKQTMEHLDEVAAELAKIPNDPAQGYFSNPGRVASWKLEQAKRALQRLIDGKLSHGIKGVKVKDDEL